MSEVVCPYCHYDYDLIDGHCSGPSADDNGEGRCIQVDRNGIVYQLLMATIMLHNTQSQKHSGILPYFRLVLLTRLWFDLEVLQIWAGLQGAHFHVCGQVQASGVALLMLVGSITVWDLHRNS